MNADAFNGPQFTNPPALTGGQRVRRNGAVVLGVTALLSSALLTGCSPDGEVIDADYAQVCQDRTTQQRVEDSKCSEEGRSSGAFGWYFFAMGLRGATDARSIPAVGQQLRGGTTSVPAGASTRSGVPAKGAASVTRGGFGGSVKPGSVGG
jgi:hypothetical protein